MGKTKKKQKKYNKKRLNTIILLLAFVAIMLVVSTYAWFSTQKNVSIMNLGGTVQVAEGMEISLDGVHFKQTLDLSKVNWTVTDDSVEYPVYEGNTNNIPEELQPVSTVGAVLGTMSDLPFYRGDYTSNGTKLNHVTECTAAITDETTKVGTIQRIENEEPVAIGAGEDDYPGYYAFDVFIKSTIQDANGVNYGTPENPVYGSPLQLNYDSFVKILEKVTGEGNKINTIDWENNLTEEELAQYKTTGLQNTLRVGFAVYSRVGSSTPTGTNVIDTTVNGVEWNGETGDSVIRQIAIWEPNSVQHVETIGDELGNVVLWDEDTATTVGSNTYNVWTDNFTGTSGVDKIYHYQMNTYGVTGAAVGNSISQVYKWVGRSENPAVVAIQNTVKTTPIELHDNPDNESEVTGWSYDELNEGVTNLYDTSADVSDPEAAKVPFWIRTNATSRIRVFVWMEGQDVDTRNIASMGHGVQLNIDLTTGETVGSHGED